MGSNWQLGKGLFTIGSYRFQIDPVSYPEDGKAIDLPQAKITGLDSSVEVQTWIPTFSNKTQMFRWRKMPDAMYQRINYYKTLAIADPDSTFDFIFHNKDPEETWTAILVSLTGNKLRAVWSSVQLQILLLEQTV